MTQLEASLRDAGVDICSSRVQLSESGPAKEHSSMPRFIGEGSGIGFIQNIVLSIRRHIKRPALAELVQERFGEAKVDCVRHDLPDEIEAAELINT